MTVWWWVHVHILTHYTSSRDSSLPQDSLATRLIDDRLTVDWTTWQQESCVLAYSATRWGPSNADALLIEYIGLSAQWLKLTLQHCITISHSFIHPLRTKQSNKCTTGALRERNFRPGSCNPNLNPNPNPNPNPIVTWPGSSTKFISSC